MIEYAEVRLNDGDGNDYINFYVDGVTHSYLLEDVFERMQHASELEAKDTVIEAMKTKFIPFLKDVQNAEQLEKELFVILAELDGAK